MSGSTGLDIPNLYFQHFTPLEPDGRKQGLERIFAVCGINSLLIKQARNYWGCESRSLINKHKIDLIHIREKLCVRVFRAIDHQLITIGKCLRNLQELYCSHPVRQLFRVK